MPPLSPLSKILIAAGTTVAFGLTALIGMLLARQTNGITLISPANAMLLAALLLTPDPRFRLATLACCALTDLMLGLAFDRSLAHSLAFTLADTFEVVVAFQLITRSCRSPIELAKVSDLTHFCIAAGLLAPLLPALTATAMTSSNHGAALATIFGTRFISDALAFLVLTPAIVLLSTQERVTPRSRPMAEVIGLFSLLSITTAVVFSQTYVAITLLPILILILVACRLGPALAAAATLLMTAIILLCTAKGLGPASQLAGSDLVVRIQFVEHLICAAFLAGLPLATLVAEQKRLETELATEYAQRDRLVSTLDEKNSRLGATLEHMSQGLCMFDAADRMVVTNDRFLDIYRLQSCAVGHGTTYRQLIALCGANGLTPECVEVQHTSKHKMTFVQKLSDGRSVSISERRLADGGRVCTYTDVTKEQQSEQRLRHMADHDVLTGLANRMLLTARIDHASSCLQTRQSLAVLFVDLDNFKYVNDTFGHATGDALLNVVAGRLRNGIRDMDTIARLGGDEFAILLTGGEQPTDAEIVSRRIVDLLDSPIVVDGQQIRVAASIGIALVSHDGATTSELLRRADVALYQAKAECRGGYKVFEPEMDRRMQARRQLEQDLRQALADRAFEVHYQPIVRLATNEVICLEALIRWQHPVRGMVSPTDFIPIAEQTGLIVPIGDWVLKQACRDAIHWPQHVKVAVNISCAQFNRPEMKTSLEETLVETGFPAGRLQLEITETTVMVDVDKATTLLGEMRAKGIEIAMDDFGTGCSSLSCLRSCPFDRLKIDRAFIKDLTTSLEARSILATIIRLAKTLGMSTTAEGIETAEQLDIVKAEGCGEMQGYYFSRPKPASEISAYFESCPATVSSAA